MSHHFVDENKARSKEGSRKVRLNAFARLSALAIGNAPHCDNEVIEVRGL